MSKNVESKAENQKMNAIKHKSEILFLYDTTWNIPNGDPFTGEQRYDEETGKILVSDVRIKRYVRTMFEEMSLPIYVSDKTGAGKTDSKGVIKWIAENRNPNKIYDIKKLLKEQIDVRLFGGISTLDNKVQFDKTDGNGNQIKDSDGKVQKVDYVNGHCQLTGPIQFSVLNPSLNEIKMKMHQNTTHFTSSADKSQGSIGTTTLVPYSVIQIHGWLNPKVAEHTGMTNNDLKLMFEAMWDGTNGEGSSHSRTKSGQNSLLILEIVYADNARKEYGINRKIKIINKDGKRDDELRSIDDFDFDFSEIHALAKSEKVKKIKYYTEIEEIKNDLTKDQNAVKFEEIKFDVIKTNKKEDESN